MHICSSASAKKRSEAVRMATCSGKNSWPELVGINGEVAVGIIMRENPRIIRAGTFRDGSRVTADFRCDRVRVWVDGRDIVTSVPKIG